MALADMGMVTPYGYMELGQHQLIGRTLALQHQAITWTNVYLSSV